MDPTSTPDPPPGRAIAPVALDDDRAWPDLNRPVEAERRAVRHEPSLLLAPTTWLPMPPSKKWYRRPVTIVGAALVLLLISGGTLVLVNSLRNPSAPGTLSGISGGPSLSQSGATGTGATTTVSATGSATGAAATGSATGAAATGVATGTTTVRPTATGASSATQQPTATSTSAPHLVTIFSDPLTSNTNGWPVQTGCAFAGGGYTVSGSTTGGASCRAPVTVPNTVNIMVTMKSTAASFSGAGIGFRVPTTGDDDYSFHISSTGACTATDEVTDVVFFNNTSCSAVATGANAVNTLKITQSGAQMGFYVNGTLVGSANDATLSTGGITLQVGTNTSMVFNNFVLTQLQ